MHCGMLNLRVPAANPPPASRFRLPPAWSMGDANRVPMASGEGGGRSCTRKRSGHHERRLPCIAHVRVRLSGNLPNHSPCRASCFTQSDLVVSPSLPLSPSLPPSSLSPSRCPVIVHTPNMRPRTLGWRCLLLLSTGRAFACFSLLPLWQRCACSRLHAAGGEGAAHKQRRAALRPSRRAAER